MTERARDPWLLLGRHTPARIAIGRAGASLPTRELLDFALAHARARDAVHAALDRTALAQHIGALGLATVEVESEATDRASYLARPDWGRRLTAASRARLRQHAAAGPCDVALVVGDGLSAVAAMRQAPALIASLLPLVRKAGLSIGPVTLAQGARVALGDDVGAMLTARLVVVLIGERPGLSAADSLGAYVTFGPRPGRTDAERNCVSNIRPEGLAPARAAHGLAWLIDAALARGITGVTLKDESGEAGAGQLDNQPATATRDANETTAAADADTSADARRPRKGRRRKQNTAKRGGRPEASAPRQPKGSTP